MKAIASAQEESKKAPLYLELQRLEVEKKRIEVWDGLYPKSYMQIGNSGSATLLIPVPQADGEGT